MGSISVCLTSSKYSLDKDDAQFLPIIELDVPVCVCEMSMYVFGFNHHEKEEWEHKWLETCKKMAKFVVVNSEKKSVYIGDSLNGEEGTGLIEYIESNDNEYNMNFLKDGMRQNH